MSGLGVMCELDVTQKQNKRQCVAKMVEQVTQHPISHISLGLLAASRSLARLSVVRYQV